MNITYADYYKKLKSCYIGKCIGGTLGMPYEGMEGPFSFTYYDPVPTEMVPNDDLDLQVVMLERVRRAGLPIHRHSLAQAWIDHSRQVFDEYGVALRNIRKGLLPPFSGAYDNKFTAGMGAIIRSELWACLCPGEPQLAASFMREDACVDHQLTGIDAACFWAAVESAAFLENDIRTLLDIGLSCIPDGRFAACIRDTVAWWDACGDTAMVRQRILDTYPSQNFTDVCLNLPFMILGWLAGGGAFGPSLCAAVNCGMDTDCVGASLGALLGILDPDGISEEWTRPIGEALILSPNMIGTHEVATISDMCDQIAALSLEVQSYYATGVKTTDAPAFTEDICRVAAPWKDTPAGVMLEQDYDPLESVIARTPIYATLVHPATQAIAPGETLTYRLKLRGLKAGNTDTYALTVSLPDGWNVTANRDTVTVAGDEDTVVELTVTAPADGKVANITTLLITLSNNHYRFDLTAGIAAAMVWLHTADNGTDSLLPLGTHYRTVPAGTHSYTATFKSGVRVENAVLVAEGNRALTVYLDGVPVASSDGSYYVPSVHRGPDRARLLLTGGWQTLRIEVADGPEEEIFVDIAKPYGLEWLEYLEWKLP